MKKIRWLYNLIKVIPGNEEYFIKYEASTTSPIFSKNQCQPYVLAAGMIDNPQSGVIIVDGNVFVDVSKCGLFQQISTLFGVYFVLNLEYPMQAKHI